MKITSMVSAECFLQALFPSKICADISLSKKHIYDSEDRPITFKCAKELFAFLSYLHISHKYA